VRRRPTLRSGSSRARAVAQPREGKIVAAILAWLTAARVWAWRANSGTIVLGKGAGKRVVRGSPAGTPDILLVLRDGRLCGLEVKRPVNGRLSESQRDWHAKAGAHAVRVAVVRSVREAMQTVEQWRAGA
jgi:hypothetical protein